MPQHVLQLRAGSAQPVEDVIEYASQVTPGLPAGRRFDLLIVAHEPGDIGGMGLLHAADLELLLAPFGAEEREFPQGDAVVVASSDPEGGGAQVLEIRGLPLDQVEEILDVEYVADLLTRSPKPR